METISNGCSVHAFSFVSTLYQAKENGFVIGTAKNLWQKNPFGFLISALPPKKKVYESLSDGPTLIVFLFWQNKVETVRSIAGQPNIELELLLSGYEFFPHDFRKEEVARLKGQLQDAVLKIGGYAHKGLIKARL